LLLIISSNPNITHQNIKKAPIFMEALRGDKWRSDYGGKSLL